MSSDNQQRNRPQRKTAKLKPLVLAMRDALKATIVPRSNPKSPNVQTPPAPARAIKFESLEPRVLMSGDINPAALTVSGNIAVQGEKDHYDFNLQESTRVVFDSLTNRADLTWQLEGPAGQIANRDFASTELGAAAAYELDAGQYHLTVDGAGDATGAYGLRLIDAAAAKKLTPGTTEAEILDSGNKTAVYSFIANAGDSFYLQSLGLSGGSVAWRLIDPYGRQEGVSGNLAIDKDTFAVQRSGEYLLLLEGSNSNTTPVPYSFNLLPVQDSVASLALDSVVTATIDQPGKVARFDCSLAQTANVFMDGLGNANGLYWRLTGPSGEVVSRQFISGSS